MLDDHCSWKLHVDKVCSKINRFAYVLWRLTRVADKKTALRAYHGFVASNLRYGILIWGNSVHIHRTFVAQKQCVRAIANIHIPTSCKEYFISLQLLTVHSMYIYEVCIFVKMHNEMFKKKRDITNINTRYPDRLVLPKMHTAMRGRNCYAMCIKIFNHLPEQLRALPLKKLRHKLFTWLVNKCFYSTTEYFANGSI